MHSRKAFRFALIQVAVHLAEAAQIMLSSNGSVHDDAGEIEDMLGSIDESLAKIRHAAGLAEPDPWHLVKLL